MISLIKWRAARKATKKNYTKRKNVNSIPLIRQSRQNLRSHVSGSTLLRINQTVPVLASKRTSQAKIGDLDVPVSVKQDIVWFKIEVDDSSRVTVMDGREHLLKVVATDLF